MKHSVTVIFIIALLMLAGCSKAFEVMRLVVYPSSVETTPLDTIQLTFALDYTGGDFEDPNLISPVWQTSNAEVVEVDSLGRIFTQQPGTADVTISCGGASAMCKVTVTSFSQPR